VCFAKFEIPIENVHGQVGCEEEGWND
jgi:hypothetical protein